MTGGISLRTRLGAGTVAAALGFASFVVVTDTPRASAAAGTVSGVAFRDLDFNGVRGATEPGVAGIDVTVTDADGAATSGVTGSDGSYVISLGPLASSLDAYRVSFDIPTEIGFYEPGPLPEVAAPSDVRNGSTLQFTAANGTAHFGVVDPTDFCERNPALATPCYTFGPVNGTNAAEPALVTFDHEVADGYAPATGRDLSSVPGAHVLASFSEIGATYGLAADPDHEGGFFNSAYIKRHSGLAGTPGSIFRVPPLGSGDPVTTLVDLPAGADPHPSNGASTQTWLRDGASYDAVGKVGLGDLDISRDRQHLYVVNLSDKRLYRVPIAAPNSYTSVAIPQPTDCAANDWRPFALNVSDGSVMVGGVCSAQSTQTVDSSFAASVFAADEATLTFDSTPVLRFGLGGSTYPRKCADGKPARNTQNTSLADNGNDPDGFCAVQGPNRGDNANWQPWENTLPTSYNGIYPRKPQPMLADIDMDDAGGLVLGFRDRFGDSTGNATYAPAGTSKTLYRGSGLGDIVRACRSGDGWALESNGTCGTQTGGGAGNGEGPGGGEFFNGDDHWYHDHIGNGGIFALPGSGLVADTVFDPLPGPETVFDGGVAWYSLDNGSRERTLRVFDGGQSNSATAGKANGLGDLEAWCDAAPIQIGDRVWLDLDRDGVQDAGEVGIQGVTVTVSDGVSDTVVTTDPSGQWSVQIDPGTDYVVTVDPSTAIGLPAGVAVDDLELVGADQADDDIDSDAVDNDGRYEISVPAHAASENDHTYDTGFSVAPEPQRIGNRVWLDSNRDGLHDDGEPGIADLIVELRSDNDDGIFEPTTDLLVATETTDEQGRYSFGDLVDGDYFVVIPAGQSGLAGLSSSPVDGVGVVDNNDDGAPESGFASVSELVTLVETATQPLGETSPEGDDDEALADTAVGPHDDDNSNLTIDFGFIRSHAIGNQVWFDINDNGTRDDGEDPAGGVTVHLLDGDGNFLAETVTNGNGLYVFDDLTPGDYIVEIPASNFAADAVLDGYRSSSPPDGSDDGVDTDDNGIPVGGDGSAVRSSVIEIGTDEPTDEVPTSSTIAADTNADLTVDFGFFIGASLGDRVWFDSDGDGQQDGDEPGIDGVIVELVADGAVIDSTVTANGGDYGFDDLEPGDYTVRFTTPDGVEPTQSDVGDDGSDSDPDADGAVDVSLSPGERNPTIDAGYGVDASIAIEKQVQDPDDPSVWYAADDLDGEAPFDDRPVAFLGGSTADYRFVVANTGSTPLAEVTVIDADLGCTFTDIEDDGDGVLAPGEIVTVADTGCDFDVTAPFTNVASVSGAPARTDGTTVEDALGLPEGTVPQVTDSDAASVRPVTPRITIEEQPALQTIPADAASVTFTMTVRNTSDGVVDLENVVVTSALCATPTYVSGDADDNGLLGQDETWVYSCTVDRPADGWPASFDNPASVTGDVPATDAAGAPLPASDPVSDDDNAEVLVGDLTVTKQVRESGADVGTGEPGAYGPNEVVRSGEDVDWQVVVTNTGGVDFEDVVLEDSECAALTGPSGDLTPTSITGDTAGDGTDTLSVGEVWVFDCSSADVDADVTSPVTVTGTPVGGDEPVTSSASASVEVVDPHVSVRIDVRDPFTGLWLDADPDDGTEGPSNGGFATIASGSDVDYRITVFNPDSGGDTADGLTLTGIAVLVTGPGGIGQTLTLPSLAPGAEHVFPVVTANAVTVASDAAAAVTAAGSVRDGEAFGPVDGADGDRDVNDQDRARIRMANVELQKDVSGNGGDFVDAPEGDPLVVQAGDDLTYRLTVTNTGGVALGNVGVDDALDGCDPALVEDGDGDTLLAPDETWVYTCTINGGFSGTVAVRNVATVTGTPTDESGVVGDPVSDDDDANVETFQPASIGDFVWHDLDQDGIQDDGEPGVSGVTVTLFDGGGAEVGSTETGDDGRYSFTDLVPGAYSVVVTVPDGWTVSALDAGSDDTVDSDIDESGATVVTTLESGEDDPTWDAGIYLPASLGDYTWLDLDADGQQDDDEPALVGVTVELLDEDGDVIDSTTSDDAGFYEFTGLQPGSYSVRFVAPDGHIVTAADVGDDASDSDADPETGETASTTLAPGQHDPTLDAGFIFPARLGDRVWVDTDRDGLQGDPGLEPGVSGVIVRLLDDSGAVLDETTTAADGLYHFEDLSPGTFVVEVVPPAGYSVTTKDAADDDSVDSDINPATGRTDPIEIVTGDDDPNWDAGIYLPSSIGDRVWADLNRNGQQDEGEPGVADVVVRLLDGDGAEVGTTFTDGSGIYRFDDLIPGVYGIEVVAPAGYSVSPRDVGSDATDSDIDPATGRTVPTLLEPGEDDPTWDAGIYQPAALGDRVWNDLDADGVQDEGEAGVVGVTVNLLDADGEILDTTTTGADGFYLFDDLIEGTYRIEVVRPAGAVFTPRDAGDDDSVDSDVVVTTGRTGLIDLPAGADDRTWDAGIVVPAGVGDRVWEDRNANGIQDAGEPGIEGVVVILTDAFGNELDRQITDDQGSYLFTDLVPGTYAVVFEAPAGFEPSPDGVGDAGLDSDADPVTGASGPVVLAADATDLSVDAGFYRPASLGDTVFHDLDADGVQDDGEPGIADVTVHLLDAGGLVIATTTTDDDGNYAFIGLVPGTYSVEFEAPAGWNPSPSNAGADDAADSDADVVTGRTAPTTLASGDDDSTLDAGFWLPASLGDRVWIDVDGDGIQDAGEPGAPGVTVNLLDDTGTIVATTVTGTNGGYSFPELEPGDYVVEFEIPDGFQATTPNIGSDSRDSDADPTTGRSGTITLDSGQTDATVDAGVYEPGAITGTVIDDTDGDGVQDAGEVGIPNVPVRLEDGDGNVVEETVTDERGDFIFDPVPPGDYTVVLIPPTSMVPSPDNVGTDDTIDSDFDDLTSSVEVVVTSGSETDVDGLLGARNADLQLVKVLVSSSAEALVWEMRVTNLGPDPMPAPIIVNDPVPAAMGVRSAVGEGWQCQQVGNDVTCTWTGDLAAGESLPPVRVTTDPPPSGVEATNGATVQGTVIEGQNSNNGDSVRVIGPEKPAVVEGTTLAKTGVEAMRLVTLGLWLLLTGAFSQGIAGQMVRRRQND